MTFAPGNLCWDNYKLFLLCSCPKFSVADFFLASVSLGSFVRHTCRLAKVWCRCCHSPGLGTMYPVGELTSHWWWRFVQVMSLCQKLLLNNWTVKKHKWTVSPLGHGILVLCHDTNVIKKFFLRIFMGLGLSMALLGKSAGGWEVNYNILVLHSIPAFGVVCHAFNYNEGDIILCSWIFSLFSFLNTFVRSTK